jgi:hypothetical protein
MSTPTGGNKEDKHGKQNIPETDTEELKRFREKWKRELQPDTALSSSVPTSSATQHQAGSKHDAASHQSSHFDLIKHNIAYARENSLITRFLVLLEEADQEEQVEHAKDDDQQSHSPPPINILPAELQLTILANLDVKSLEYCSIVCRFWYILARYDSLSTFCTYHKNI